ncbi:oxidoreductase [Chitinophagaceae bacterium MMS25-I14]
MYTPQQPVQSGFTAASTAADVIKGIDLTGKTAIVTGGYSGIGLETVRVFHHAGAKVIVPARDINKATAALEGLSNVEIWPMELTDPASVTAFAERFLTTGIPLHILVNNAGIMATPLARDARGYESQFATNHLGHFQLTTMLWPALQRANGARIISVSSWGHRFSPVVFDDVHFEHRDYDRWLAYGQSKTANVLFAVEADKRGQADGIRAFSLHPGSIVATGLGKYVSAEDLKASGILDENGEPILDPSRQLKTIQQGAATTVWCATSAQLNDMGGVYCENSDVSPLIPKEDEENRRKVAREMGSLPLGVLPYAVDADAAARLWAMSEELTGYGI